MPPLIDQHRSEIEALCRKYGVRRLELFGSAARGDFDAAASDLDFLVLFDRRSSMRAPNQFFGLLDDLERLFGRSIDLVDITAATNPYFVAEALRHRVRLYAA